MSLLIPSSNTPVRLQVLSTSKIVIYDGVVPMKMVPMESIELNQCWFIVAGEENYKGWYKIKHLWLKKVLASTATDNEVVMVNDSPNDDKQYWDITQGVGSYHDYFLIRNKERWAYLDGGPGKPILFPIGPNNNQYWKFNLDIKERIVSDKEEKKYLTLEANAIIANSNPLVGIWKDLGDPASALATNIGVTHFFIRNCFQYNIYFSYPQIPSIAHKEPFTKWIEYKKVTGNNVLKPPVSVLKSGLTTDIILQAQKVETWHLNFLIMDNNDVSFPGFVFNWSLKFNFGGFRELIDKQVEGGKVLASADGDDTLVYNDSKVGISVLWGINACFIDFIDYTKDLVNPFGRELTF